MHFPVEFELGKMTLKAHFVLEVMAYFIGYHFYLYQAKKTNFLSEDNRLWIITGGILGAAFFSKLLGLMEHPQLFALSVESWYYLVSSKTIVGGLLGAIIGVEIAKKFLGIKKSTGDNFCFPAILGIIIGRLGCFLEGADDGTWGNPTSFILGIDGGDGTLRHPTPLYEIMVLSFIWLLLLFIKRKIRLAEGGLFKIFMVLYLSWRLSIEFIKPVYLIEPIGLSAIQIACVMGLVYYIKVILKSKKQISYDSSHTINLDKKR